MRKLLSLLMVLFFVAALTSCGGAEATDPGTDDKDTTEQQDPAPVEPDTSNTDAPTEGDADAPTEGEGDADKKEEGGH